MRRLATLSLLLTFALAMPAGALAAGQSNPLLPNSSNPLSPGIPPSQTTTPTTTAPPIVNTTTTSSSGTFSGSTGVMIGIAALVVLLGISFFIWRDARRRAPVRSHAALADGAGGRSGSKARPKPRKMSPAEKRRRKRGRAR